MTTPDWWQFLILGLGVYRLVRLAAYDDLTTTLRAELVGISDEAHSQWSYALNAVQKIGHDPWVYDTRHTAQFQHDVAAATGSEELPPLVRARIDWITPAAPPVTTADTLEIRPVEPVAPFSERRWYFSKLVRCPWCLSVHIVMVVWVARQIWPHATLAVMAIPALWAIPGLIAKNLDQ